MSSENSRPEFAVRVSTTGFAFTVRHLFAPVIESGHALVAGLQARARRRQALNEINELPEYLRRDIGLKP